LSDIASKSNSVTVLPFGTGGRSELASAAQEPSSMQPANIASKHIFWNWPVT